MLEHVAYVGVLLDRGPVEPHVALLGKAVNLRAARGKSYSNCTNVGPMDFQFHDAFFAFSVVVAVSLGFKCQLCIGDVVKKVGPSQNKSNSNPGLDKFEKFLFGRVVSARPCHC